MQTHDKKDTIEESKNPINRMTHKDYYAQTE